MHLGWNAASFCLSLFLLGAGVGTFWILPESSPHGDLSVAHLFNLLFINMSPSTHRQPSTSACLPACWPPLLRPQLEERLANNWRFGAQCSSRLPVLSGGRLHAWRPLQWAALGQPVKCAFATEKYWSALLQTVRECMSLPSPPITKDNSQPDGRGGNLGCVCDCCPLKCDMVLSAPRLYTVKICHFLLIHQTSFGAFYLVSLLFVNCHGA